MTNRSEIPIIIEDTRIEYVKEYIYLGKQISFDPCNNEEEIKRRIQFAWNKYWSLREILKSNMHMNIKTKVMNMCILPTLTYGSQTWKLTDKAKRMITSCQRAMERSILKIRRIHKIRHCKIRQKTKIKDALTYIQKSKWKWAGHVARLTDNRWSYMVTNWPGPKGTRRAGRPHFRWEDDLKKVAGPNWLLIAKNRKNWSNLEEAFTCKKGSPT